MFALPILKIIKIFASIGTEKGQRYYLFALMPFLDLALTSRL